MRDKGERNKIISKLTEWVKRYWPAEVAAIIGALVGGALAHCFFDEPITTALGGTWGENAGYYGLIIFRDLNKKKQKGEQITFPGVLKILRNIAIEFGPAEYLDSFVIRPAAMYFFPKLTGNVPLGLFLGKISADVTFYLPAILTYEIRTKYLKD